MSKQKRSSITAGRIAGIIGLLMIVGSLLATSLLPGGLQRTPQPTEFPTSAPLPTPTPVTFPTPDPAGSGLTVAAQMVHPAGTFAIPLPEGFTATPSNQDGIHSLSLVDWNRYTVIHAYLQQTSAALDIAGLDELNNEEMLAGSWSYYDSWEETGRTLDEDRLTIDFTISLFSNEYRARHITWPGPDDDRPLMGVVRLVVPDNNPTLLDDLEALILGDFVTLTDGLTASLSWGGTVDEVAGFALRHPVEWTMSAGGLGEPTTLDTGSGTLTLAGDDSPVEDDAAAEAWVLAAVEDATIDAVQPVERALGAGFAVAYTASPAIGDDEDEEGDSQSGVVVLVNTPAGKLVTANLLLTEGDAADLLAEDVSSDAPLAAEWLALQTFAPLPESLVLSGEEA